jgi:hypothetical protein
MADPTAPDEEGITEPVEIPQNFVGRVGVPSERDAHTLRAAADSSAYMQFRVEAAAPRKNK